MIWPGIWMMYWRQSKTLTIALKEIRKDKFLAVVYKELEQADGFIITAYFSSKIKLNREVILWQRK